MIVSKRVALTFLVAFYSLLVITLLPVVNSVDAVSYLYYAEFSRSVLDARLSLGWLYLLFNEPLWLVSNIALFSVFGSPVAVVFSIAFFNFFVCALFVLTYAYSRYRELHSAIALSFLLLLPIFIANSVVNLRQGFALAFVLIAFGKPYYIKWLFLVLSPFIHLGFALVFAQFLMVAMLCRTSFSLRVCAMLISLANLSFPLFLGLVFNASFVDARQAGWDQNISFSGIGFLFWLLIFFFAFIGARNDLREAKTWSVYFKVDEVFLLGVGFLSLYLSLYFSFYGAARYLQLGLPFIFASLFYFKFSARLVSVFLLTLLIIFDWFVRAGQPNLGF